MIALCCCGIGFSWHALTVKGTNFKGKFTLFRIRQSRSRPSLTHSPSTFLHSWQFWSQFCDAVYVTQYVAFLGTLTVLFATDGDFSLSLTVVTRYPLGT